MTTTATLIHNILKAAGVNAGIVSTVNAVVGDELDTGFHVTTPEAPEKQRFLKRMVAAGLTHVILEATSHGLAQHRVGACDFDMAVITNITHEHLDYHGTFDAYREPKGRLFSSLAEVESKSFYPPRGALLNQDDDSFEYLSAITKVGQLSFGLNPLANIQAKDTVLHQYQR